MDKTLYVFDSHSRSKICQLKLRFVYGADAPLPASLNVSQSQWSKDLRGTFAAVHRREALSIFYGSNAVSAQAKDLKEYLSRLREQNYILVAEDTEFYYALVPTTHPTLASFPAELPETGNAAFVVIVAPNEGQIKSNEETSVVAVNTSAWPASAPVDSNQGACRVTYELFGQNGQRIQNTISASNPAQLNQYMQGGFGMAPMGMPMMTPMYMPGQPMFPPAMYMQGAMPGMYPQPYMQPGMQQFPGMFPQGGMYPQMQGQMMPGQMQGQMMPGQMQGMPGQMQGQMMPGQMQGQMMPGQMQGQGMMPGQMQGQMMPGQMQGQGQMMPGQMQGQGQMPGQMQGQGQMMPGQMQGQGQMMPGQMQGQGQMQGFPQTQGQVPGQPTRHAPNEMQGQSSQSNTHTAQSREIPKPEERKEEVVDKFKDMRNRPSPDRGERTRGERSSYGGDHDDRSSFGGDRGDRPSFRSDNRGEGTIFGGGGRERGGRGGRGGGRYGDRDGGRRGGRDGRDGSRSGGRRRDDYYGPGGGAGGDRGSGKSYQGSGGYSNNSGGSSQGGSGALPAPSAGGWGPGNCGTTGAARGGWDAGNTGTSSAASNTGSGVGAAASSTGGSTGTSGGSWGASSQPAAGPAQSGGWTSSVPPGTSSGEWGPASAGNTRSDAPAVAGNASQPDSKPSGNWGRPTAAAPDRGSSLSDTSQAADSATEPVGGGEWRNTEAPTPAAAGGWGSSTPSSAAKGGWGAGAAKPAAAGSWTSTAPSSVATGGWGPGAEKSAAGGWGPTNLNPQPLGAAASGSMTPAVAPATPAQAVEVEQATTDTFVEESVEMLPERAQSAEPSVATVEGRQSESDGSRASDASEELLSAADPAAEDGATTSEVPMVEEIEDPMLKLPQVEEKEEEVLHTRDLSDEIMPSPKRVKVTEAEPTVVPDEGISDLADPML